jgi:pimeloyl-ACP methyl ester carboxylesterase
MQPMTVTTPDGLAIAAQEWGNPGGPEIVFIHGFNQCHLSWIRQVTSADLLRDFRMITFDLRGHGGSDKPLSKEHYTNDQRWGDDLAAVIAAARLKRPVLVAWSLGARIVTDYLRTHGAAGLAGIDFVGAVTKSDNAMLGPGIKHISGMLSDDLTTSIAATRNFLRACFERQPPVDDFETMLAFNMLTPPKVRGAVLTRTPNSGDLLPGLLLPVLVTHGAKDQFALLALAEFTAATVPGARLSVYDDIGHTPFMEDAPRFNRELATFVAVANER